MYKVTQASIDVLSLDDLTKARKAIDQLAELDIYETDVDVRRYINVLISKKEQTQI